jgi:flavin reductase (DIM6/NTAB) family NADH-FMN oxidoreductase RutF
MHIDLSTLSKRQIHQLMIQSIIPRPVAWVLSDNGNATYNLAPFSYFSGISSDPPLLMLSVGHKPDGSRKDTWVNVLQREDFVVHIAPRDLAEKVTETSVALPHGESELDVTGLQTTEMPGSRLPRVVGPRIALACTKFQILEIGNGPQGLIFGQIQHVYVDDDVVREQGDKLHIDASKVHPVARLGGDDYGFLGDTQTVPRPGTG